MWSSSSGSKSHKVSFPNQIMCWIKGSDVLILRSCHKIIISWLKKWLKIDIVVVVIWVSPQRQGSPLQRCASVLRLVLLATIRGLGAAGVQASELTVYIKESIRYCCQLRIPANKHLQREGAKMFVTEMVKTSTNSKCKSKLSYHNGIVKNIDNSQFWIYVYNTDPFPTINSRAATNSYFECWFTKVIFLNNPLISSTKSKVMILSVYFCLWAT